MPFGFDSTLSDMLFYALFFGFLYLCYTAPAFRIIGYGVIAFIIIASLVRRFVTMGIFTDVGTDLAYVVVIAGACLFGKDADDHSPRM